MNWFGNWKIRTKILSLIILMALFIGSVGFIGYYYNAKSNAQMSDLYSNNLLGIKYLNNAHAQTRAGEASIFHFLLETDNNKQQVQLNEMSIREDNFDKSLNDYLKLPADSYEKERQPKIQTEIATYRAERQKAIDLENQGDQKGACNYFTQNALSHLESYTATLQELADHNASKANDVISQTERPCTEVQGFTIATGSRDYG